MLGVKDGEDRETPASVAVREANGDRPSPKLAAPGARVSVDSCVRQASTIHEFSETPACVAAFARERCKSGGMRTFSDPLYGLLGSFPNRSQVSRYSSTSEW